MFCLQGAGGVGGLLASERSSGAQWMHYDSNGNVILLTDNQGVESGRYSYDAFGRTLSATGAAAESNRYRFSTKPAESIGGLSYYGYRYYDPVSGRWPSRDPIEENGGLNLYAMVGNCLTNCIDSLGLVLMPPDAWSNLPTSNATGYQQVGVIHSRPIDPATPIMSDALTYLAAGYADHFFLVLNDGAQFSHGGSSDSRPGDITIPLRIPDNIDSQKFKICLKKNWPSPETYNTFTKNCRQGMNEAIKKCLQEAAPKAPAKPKRPWWFPVPVLS